MAQKKPLPDLTKLGRVDRILIVRYFALGDIALSVPIVRGMREAFPESEISYLVWERYSDALLGVEEVDRVIILKEGIFEWLMMARRLRRDRYDFILDLVSSPGSAQLSWLSGAKVRIGMETGRNDWCYHYLLPRRFEKESRKIKYYTLDTNRELMKMMVTGSDGMAWTPVNRSDDASLEIGFPPARYGEDWAKEYFAGLPSTRGGYAGITASSSYLSKSWPIENLSKLAREIHYEFDIIPVIIWGPGEEKDAMKLRDSVKSSILPPLIKIPELGAMIRRLRFLVGIDSGPKHIAVLEGVPTVTLFGPTDPMVWDPVTEKHRVLSVDMECFPCRDRDCPDNRCMKDIEVDDVLDEIRKIIR
ncbi:MAG: glycosyltransferase family 9 protein [Candidatus Krumholzibacteriota bacterium]|nr:glycosyltransferase family 9 protein [Candidatus Krumholzibacteriota bacterium]